MRENPVMTAALELAEKPPTVGFVSLGCPKALTDSELILTQLRAEGYETSKSYAGADLVIVNTCGFIDDAVKESLDTIGEALAANGKVIVTGCLGAQAGEGGGNLVREMHPSVLAVTGPHATQAVMDAVVPYSHDRRQFGQSIGEFQLIQGKVADMYTVLQAARAFCYTVGKNLDLLGSEHVRQVRKDCASVILWCAEKATWMAGEGIQVFGGNGYINEFPLGRLWRDAKLYEIGAGTSEIRRMLIGRQLFEMTG